MVHLWQTWALALRRRHAAIRRICDDRYGIIVCEHVGATPSARLLRRVRCVVMDDCYRANLRCPIDDPRSEQAIAAYDAIAQRLGEPTMAEWVLSDHPGD